MDPAEPLRQYLGPCPGRSLVGYEIHHGRSSGTGGGDPLFDGAGAEMGLAPGAGRSGAICTGLLAEGPMGAGRSSTWSDKIAGVRFSRSDPPDPIELRIDRWGAAFAAELPQ